MWDASSLSVGLTQRATHLTLSFFSDIRTVHQAAWAEFFAKQPKMWASYLFFKAHIPVEKKSLDLILVLLDEQQWTFLKYPYIITAFPDTPISSKTHCKAYRQGGNQRAPAHDQCDKVHQKQNIFFSWGYTWWFTDDTWKLQNIV